MQKERLASNHPFWLGKSIPGAQKNTNHWSKKTKTMPIRRSAMRLLIKTRIRSSPLIYCLLLINLRLRPPTSRSVKKKSKEKIIQPLGSTPLGYQKKIRRRPKTWAMLSATPVSRKVTMQKSALTSQKTSGGFGNLHVGKWEKGEIRAGTLYLVSHYFRGSGQDFAGLKNRS